MLFVNLVVEEVLGTRVVALTTCRRFHRRMRNSLAQCQQITGETVGNTKIAKAIGET